MEDLLTAETDVGTESQTDGDQQTGDQTQDTEPVLSPLVGADGKFAEGWRDRIHEDYRGEPCLDVIGDNFDAMVKNYVYAQKMRGKNTVAVPTDKSDQSEWDMFFEATGRPTLAADYKIEKPAEMPDEMWSSERAEAFAQEAWNLGLNQTHIDKLMAFDNARTLEAVKAAVEAKAQARADAETTLRAQLGDAYDEQMHLANAFIAKTTTEEQREHLLEVAGNDPHFIAWIAEWGAKTAESHGIDTSSFKSTPAQSQERLTELQATPGYIDGSLKKENPLRHEKIVKEISELSNKLYASGPRK